MVVWEDTTFTSRFILGSGKFSLDLVKACIEKADAQIITLALRRANEGGLANILDYIPDNVTLTAKYIRSKKCRRSCQNRKIIKRSWMRGFCKNRSCPRLQIFIAG